MCIENVNMKFWNVLRVSNLKCDNWPTVLLIFGSVETALAIVLFFALLLYDKVHDVISPTVGLLLQRWMVYFILCRFLGVSAK